MFLGIEIGGTKLQLGIGPGDGTLAGLWRGIVDVAAGPDGIRRQIVAAIPELLARSNLTTSDLKGVGIGFGGPVDDATHTVIKSHQIEGWDNFPLADWISEIVGLPTALGNDADVAGLAEALFGAGKGLSPIFYITIGSGIGGGLIINGEIYRGGGRGAAEIGHLNLSIYHQDHSGKNLDETCDHTVLEKMASGWAIQDRVSTYFEFFPTTLPILRQMVSGWREATAQRVAEAAERGDVYAYHVLHESWNYLADGICDVIAILCPRRIVIGGGVSLMGEELLFQPLRKLVAERVFKPFADCYDIVPAALGEEVVVHGALALARKWLSR
jgi:glucokinase